MREYITVGLLLLFVAGCGTQVGGKTPLAEARTACEEWDGVSYTDDEWDAMVIVYSELSNSGGTKGQVLTLMLEGCYENPEFAGQESECTVCTTKLIDATW